MNPFDSKLLYRGARPTMRGPPPGEYRERLIRGIGWATSDPFCATAIGGQSAGNRRVIGDKRHIECWSASGRETDLPEKPSNDRCGVKACAGELSGPEFGLPIAFTNPHNLYVSIDPVY